MKVRTKIAFDQAASGTPGNDKRRRTNKRHGAGARRARSRIDRDRMRSAVSRYAEAEFRGVDATVVDRENDAISMLLDVEFDHDELGEFILGRAGSTALAISREEDEVLWY